jgi:hypothetical protein
VARLSLDPTPATAGKDERGVKRKRRRSAWAAVVALTCASVTSGIPHSAWASDSEVSVRRTRLVDASPSREPDADTAVLAQKIDSILYEAVQDLGLSIDISSRAPEGAAESDEQLLAGAARSWVVAPRLERRRGRLVLSIVVAPPGSRVLYATSASIQPDELEMRTVVMMRDLVRAARGAPNSGAPAASEGAEAAKHGAPAASEAALPAHSPGRAILALNAALLGGFVGYSLQHASGSTDERLTYPLAALGAGVGLGGSMLVTEEWDVGVGDAWFLSAGMWWPLLSGTLLSRGYQAPKAERYAYGLLGTTAGVTLATTALGFGHVSDGGAVLTHSGGAFGTLLGALVQLSIEGSTDERPYRGMGYGAGAGVLLAGALATQVQIPASSVLMIDLGASLGALTGAAAASPLLLVDESESNGHARNRLWLASVAAGTVAGGVLGWWVTRPLAGSKSTHALMMPSLGVVAATPEGPAFGAGVQGSW